MSQNQCGCGADDYPGHVAALSDPGQQDHLYRRPLGQPEDEKKEQGR